MAILKPQLVIPVGKLAIEQFLANARLDTVVGKMYHVRFGGYQFDLAPLPHPSGASPWHRMEPGKTLLQKGLALIEAHPAFRDARAGSRQVSPGFADSLR